MACEGVIDIVTRESGRFSDEIWRRMFPTAAPIVGLTEQAEFPEGMGNTISNLTYERTAPLVAEPTWRDIVDLTGDPNILTSETGGCVPPATKLNIGSTVRTYHLQRVDFEGPDFCVEHLRSPFQVRAQLEAILSILMDYSRISWEIRDRHEYVRMTQRKIIVNSGGSIEVSGAGAIGEVFPTAVQDAATCPDATLSMGILNKYKIRLRRDGANESALGREDGQAILTLVTDAETADRLIFENADIRQDIRYGQPNELLKPYGVERSYRGFYFLVDDFPIRFTCAAGVFTEVPAFITANATKGVKADLNPAYETADGTVSYIFDRMVLLKRIPRPIVSPAPGYKFNAVNYSGVFYPLNILDRDCNPNGTVMFHRAILASGTEPRKPERGVAFYHKNCPPPGNYNTACGEQTIAINP